MSLLLVLLQFNPVAAAEAENTEPDETSSLDIGDDLEITLHRFGKADTRVLWFPHEMGINQERLFPLAKKMAAQGLEILMLPLHEDYFLAPGRNSLSKIPAQHIAAIIRNTLAQHPQQPLYLFTAGRGAALVATGLAALQSETPLPAIAGLILMHPDFTANTVEPGQSVDYLPVTTRLHAPIYIFQPEKSGRRWYLEQLVEKLEQGGSEVLTQLIADAGEGYLMRPQPRGNEAEQVAKFPQQFNEALAELEQVKLAPRPPGLDGTELQQTELAAYKDTLQPYPGDVTGPDFSLPDMNGKVHQLRDYRGKVVLLNFWASWCPPCVHEVPSLGRLQQKFDTGEFVVLSVDMGEEREDVAAFLEKIPADYPVMLDTEGTTVQDWKLSAFPTTFVLDREGYIRLAYFGGLEWDEPEVVTTLEKTFRLKALKTVQKSEPE
jgi:thiol-disulfide isomerase/thioredoxin